MIRKIFTCFALLLILSLLVSNPVQAQVGIKKLGQSTMNFLKVSVSPKAAGMGNAYTSIGDGEKVSFTIPPDWPV
ncbi:MAG: hypothetical protein U5R06_05435 [candidate division KSB1 bacterium]|nr:hypothetical protein [candidate division KSB1 bacterium]